MLKLKSLLVLFFIATLSYSGFSQPIFTVSATNLNQTVADIQQIYGNQIDLSSTAIENYLLPFVQNAQTTNMCPPPDPQVEQIVAGSISFSWPAISGTATYGTYYLNLNDGTTGAATTSAPGHTFTGLTPGLYAFGFYTDCGPGLGIGWSSLIIVDIDIIMPDGPPVDCDCELSYPVVLEDEPGDRFSYEWPLDSPKTTFKFEVNGIDLRADPEDYYSSVVFTYDLLYGEPVIYLYSYCDSNALSSAFYPRYVGAKEEDGFYNISFNDYNLVLDFSLSDFELGDFELMSCKPKKEIGKGRSGVLSSDIALNHFEIYPNPSEQQTQISYQLSEDAEIQIIAYDLLGKIVKEILPLSPQRKGIHQLPVDLHSWSPGTYTVQFQSPNYKKTLKLIKVE